MTTQRRTQFVISSLVTDDGPFVTITVGELDFHAGMTPADAVELAHQLMAAAEAATSDAVTFEFLQKKIELTEEEAGIVVDGIRQARDKTYPHTPNEVPND